jgi:Uma2 family endonuclease
MQMQTRRFTYDEYMQLGKSGIIGPKERVELLDGDILVMPPIGPDHWSTVMRMTHVLIEHLGRRTLVMAQGEIKLDALSAPQPDIAFLRPKESFYRGCEVEPRDILALLEVSHSSLAFDRGRKLLAYARAGIPEYWIANLIDWTMTRYTLPHELGYAASHTYEHGESVTLGTLPPVTLPVAELLGTPL